MIGECRMGLYEKAMPPLLSWEERLRAAKNAGYDFMEISIDESKDRLSRLELCGKEKSRLLRIMESEEFFLESMCLSGHRKFPLGSLDKKKRELSLEIMKKAILFSRDMGIRTIQLAGYDVYYEQSSEQTEKWFKENLKRCVEWAEQFHVMLAFETMETPFLNTVEKCMKYIEEMSSPWLQIYPDSGNLTNAAGGDAEKVLADLSTGKGHLAAMHLKESLPGKFRGIPFGSGHVNFKALIREAKSLGVRRFVAEAWYAEGQDWEAEIQEIYEFLKPCF